MKLIILFIGVFASVFFGSACTTFVLQDSSNLVFGRNLDWYSDNGIIVVNKRGVNKESLVFSPDKSIKWTSKYGSVSFNQFGKEFPFGGVNEKGLVIELMVVDGNYPLFDNRPAVNELQWVQFQLDNCSTIDEVIFTDKFLRISQIDQVLHFLICDRKGNVAVIEFIDNKMKVRRGKELPFPVLENETYQASLNNIDYSPESRFSVASKLVNNYKANKSKSIVDYSFHILDEVALDSSWSIVYDIKNMQIHFKTASNRNIRLININQFDFSCKSPTLVYDLKQKHKKEITTFFSHFTSELNLEIIKNAIVTNNIVLPDAILKKIYNYHETCDCK